MKRLYQGIRGLIFIWVFLGVMGNLAIHIFFGLFCWVCSVAQIRLHLEFVIDL